MKWVAILLVVAAVGAARLRCPKTIDAPRAQACVPAPATYKRLLADLPKLSSFDEQDDYLAKEAWKAAVERTRVSAHVIDLDTETARRFEERYPCVASEIERNCIVPAGTTHVVCDAAVIRELVDETQHIDASFVSSFEWQSIERPLFILLLQYPKDSADGIQLRQLFDEERAKAKIPSITSIFAAWAGETFPTDAVYDGLRRNGLDPDRARDEFMLWKPWVDLAHTTDRKLAVATVAREVVRRWFSPQFERTSATGNLELAIEAVTFLLRHEQEHVLYPPTGEVATACDEFDPSRASTFLAQRNREVLADLRGLVSALEAPSIAPLVGALVAIRVTNRISLADLGLRHTSTIEAPPELLRAMRSAPLLAGALDQTRGRLSGALFPASHAAPLLRLWTITQSGLDSMPVFPTLPIRTAAYAHWLAAARWCGARGQPDRKRFATDLLTDLARHRAALDAADPYEYLARMRIARQPDAVPGDSFGEHAFVLAETVERLGLQAYFAHREAPTVQMDLRPMVEQFGCLVVEEATAAGVDAQTIGDVWRYDCEQSRAAFLRGP